MAVLHPRVAPRRSTTRATTWWGKAWVRAVEEAAFSESDLATARTLARGGHVGQITTRPGGFVASVEDQHGLWTVDGAIPELDETGIATVVETVAAEAGRIASLLGGDLPHDLVEHTDEAGVELLPFGSELAATCTCEAWAEPCPHALAVLQQLAWLIEADPIVLLQLRGLARDDLLARLHARREPPVGDDERDLDAAVEAALYAARLLDDGSSASGAAIDHPQADDPLS